MMVRTKRHRGFVMLLALALLAIVGTAVLVLAAAMSFDGGRTLDRARDAQLDQMLLAGASEAIEHVAEKTPAPGDGWEVELPQSLSEQTAKLSTKVDSTENGQVVLTIRAAIQNRSAEQVIRLNRAGDAWRVASAVIPQAD